jgi:NADH:ubiquinone oxidoreductase subunit 4 (subunit M)
MARGRPALATLLMTLGVIALAVPGSGNFAGEFLILTGVFTSGWGWSVVGAVAIVLAAMYMLRLISAVLHQAKGSAVPDTARDLRLPELGLLVPLVVLLIFFSAWPAAITDHTFGQQSSTPAVKQVAARTPGWTQYGPMTRIVEGRPSIATLAKQFKAICSESTIDCIKVVLLERPSGK